MTSPLCAISMDVWHGGNRHRTAARAVRRPASQGCCWPPAAGGGWAGDPRRCCRTGKAAGGARGAGAARGRLRPGPCRTGRRPRRGARAGGAGGVPADRQPGLGRGHGHFAAGRAGARRRGPGRRLGGARLPGGPARYRRRRRRPGAPRVPLPDTLAAASYGGRRGHPVLFGARHWAAVARSAYGDVGARAYLREREGRIALVECGDVADPADIDTPEDLGRLG